MKTYALKIGKELFKVSGAVNKKGFLEWKQSDGSQGVAKYLNYCLWDQRRTYFPDCKDSK